MYVVFNQTIATTAPPGHRFLTCCLSHEALAIDTAVNRVDGSGHGNLTTFTP